MTGKSTFHLLDSSAKNGAQRPVFFLEDGDTISYERFVILVERCAAHLHAAHEIARGERVALFLGNTLEFCIAVFATLRLGATVVPLNTKLRSAEYTQIIKSVTPRLIVCGVTQQEVESRLVELAPVFNISEWLDTSDNYQLAEPAPSMHEAVDEHDPAFIMFTSGTTGRPKGVLITHANILRACKTYATGFGLENTDITVIAVPIFHGTGLFGQLFPLIYVGGAVVLQRRYSTDGLLDLVETYHATHFIGVPTMYIYLLQHSDVAKRLASLRKAGNGGAPLPAIVSEQLAVTFPWVEFFNTYGLTETTSPATMLHSTDFFRKIGSVGTPTPRMSARIIDEQTGEECPPKVVGELQLSGELVTPGYWQNDEANRAAFSSGWFRTGDLAAKDADGYIYLRGRSKDMISRGGEKIYPAEVEAVLLQHAGIAEANVFGVSDPVYGESVSAQIVLAPGVESLTPEELSVWCRPYLAKFKTPTSFQMVEEIPKNAGGKPIKPRLSF